MSNRDNYLTDICYGNMECGCIAHSTGRLTPFFGEQRCDLPRWNHPLRGSEPLHSQMEQPSYEGIPKLALHSFKKKQKQPRILRGIQNGHPLTFLDRTTPAYAGKIAQGIVSNTKRPEGRGYPRYSRFSGQPHVCGDMRPNG